MSARSTQEYTAALLHGAPVGTPDGAVICYGCHAGIAESAASREEPVAHVDHVYVSVTQLSNSNEWFLQWVNCPVCGPVDSGESPVPDDIHATATLAYDPSLGSFVLDEIDLPTEGDQ